MRNKYIIIFIFLILCIFLYECIYLINCKFINISSQNNNINIINSNLQLLSNNNYKYRSINNCKNCLWSNRSSWEVEYNGKWVNLSTLPSNLVGIPDYNSISISILKNARMIINIPLILDDIYVYGELVVNENTRIIDTNNIIYTNALLINNDTLILNNNSYLFFLNLSNFENNNYFEINGNIAGINAQINKINFINNTNGYIQINSGGRFLNLSFFKFTNNNNSTYCYNTKNNMPSNYKDTILNLNGEDYDILEFKGEKNINYKILNGNIRVKNRIVFNLKSINKNIIDIVELNNYNLILSENCLMYPQTINLKNWYGYFRINGNGRILKEVNKNITTNIMYFHIGNKYYSPIGLRFYNVTNNKAEILSIGVIEDTMQYNQTTINRYWEINNINNKIKFTEYDLYLKYDENDLDIIKNKFTSFKEDFYLKNLIIYNNINNTYNKYKLQNSLIYLQLDTVFNICSIRNNSFSNFGFTYDDDVLNIKNIIDEKYRYECNNNNIYYFFNIKEFVRYDKYEIKYKLYSIDKNNNLLEIIDENYIYLNSNVFYINIDINIIDFNKYEKLYLKITSIDENLENKDFILNYKFDVCECSLNSDVTFKIIKINDEDELNLDLEFILNNYFKCNYNNYNINKINITIYNIYGQIIYFAHFTHNINEYDLNFIINDIKQNISNNNNTMYILRISKHNK